jgi:hypothetical protein
MRLAGSVSGGDATSGGLLTLFAVYGNNAVFPSLDGFSGTNHGAQRLFTVIAGAGKISQERLGEFPLFNRGYSSPVGGASRYVMPIFASNTAGEAPDAPSLVKVEASLHSYLPIYYLDLKNNHQALWSQYPVIRSYR